MHAADLRERMEHQVHVTFKHVCAVGIPIFLVMVAFATQAAVLSYRVSEHQHELESRRGIAADLVRVSTQLSAQVGSNADFRAEVRTDIAEIKQSQRDLEVKLDRLIQMQLEERRRLGPP